MFNSRIRAIIAAGIAVFAAAGCGDSTAPQTRAVTAPPVSPPSLALMRGTVDVAAGTLLFEPVGGVPSHALTTSSLISAQVYGNQGVTVRLYSTPVTVVNPSSPGKKTYSAAVGLRNLLPHGIGDEQSAASPVDTMGVFVLFTTAPFVSSPSTCAGCTVTLLNPDGVGAFDAPNEQYFYWKDRLREAGSGFDTTLTRRTWTFEASSGVTNFSFDVLVSAAWPEPYESVWRVAFDGDSLPDTQSEPRWRRVASASGTSAAASGGALTLTEVQSGVYISFLRQDSLAPATSAFMEGRIRLDQAPGAVRPYTGMVIDDDTRTIGVGLSASSVGFVNGALNGFLAGGTVSRSASTYRTYQLRKFGADSVQLWVDGARVLSRAYSQFDLSTQSGYTSYLSFGSISRQYANTATYDYVTYVLGQPTP